MEAETRLLRLVARRHLSTLAECSKLTTGRADQHHRIRTTIANRTGLDLQSRGEQLHPFNESKTIRRTEDIPPPKIASLHLANLTAPMMHRHREPPQPDQQDTGHHHPQWHLRQDQQLQQPQSPHMQEHHQCHHPGLAQRVPQEATSALHAAAAASAEILEEAEEPLAVLHSAAGEVVQYLALRAAVAHQLDRALVGVTALAAVTVSIAILITTVDLLPGLAVQVHHLVLAAHSHRRLLRPRHSARAATQLQQHTPDLSASEQVVSLFQTPARGLTRLLARVLRGLTVRIRLSLTYLSQLREARKLSHWST